MILPYRWFPVIGLSFALAACGAEPEPAVDPLVDNAIEEDSMMTEHSPGLDLEASTETAQAKLAVRLEVEIEDIAIVEARRVTWSDGAMGCPETDMMYTQALVEGYYIVFRVKEENYAYHAGSDGQPFYCPADRSKEPSASPSLY